MVTALAFVWQTIAQAHVSPMSTSILLSLESVFGVFFSVVLYGEALTPSLVVGFLLVFAAILTSELAGREALTGQGTGEL